MPPFCNDNGADLAGTTSTDPKSWWSTAWFGSTR